MAKKRKKKTTKRYQKQRQTQNVYINSVPQHNEPFSRIQMRILSLERQQATKQNEADWIGKRQNTALLENNAKLQETANAAWAARNTLHAQLSARQGDDNARMQAEVEATPSRSRGGGRGGGGGSRGRGRGPQRNLDLLNTA